MTSCRDSMNVFRKSAIIPLMNWKLPCARSAKRSLPICCNRILPREPGEDVQLACYAYAHEAADAAFVSIENGKVRLVEPKDDVPLLAQLNAERLVSVMANIRGGVGLPANGIDQACMHCEIRGVCRKGEWISGCGIQDAGFSSPLPLEGEGR